MDFNWKAKAATLYLDGLTIMEISDYIGISARSISTHLNSLPTYAAERQRRKLANQDRRAYFREHKRKVREINIIPCAEILKKEHKTAVRILSRERFF